jgi:flagellar motor switch/type III secretory pathway protein FliN
MPVLVFDCMGSATALAEQAEQIQPVEAGDGARQALIPSPQGVVDVLSPSNGWAGRLPVELDVAVPLKSFRVRKLLALAPGTVVESQWGHGEDLPLACGDVQLAWTEFEVIETQLAVRLTRLA